MVKGWRSEFSRLRRMFAVGQGLEKRVFADEANFRGRSTAGEASFAAGQRLQKRVFADEANLRGRSTAGETSFHG